MVEKEYNIPESRKLEFKETLPSGNKIERTAVAFSNDAGGEIYIGIRNDPREITGIPENELIKLEEQISNIIYENCNPTILPDILVQKIEDKYILVVKIPRGSLPPYYIKSLGKENGTFIRVGSSNRLADREIIEELERKSRSISYDSTSVYELKPDELDLSSFTKLYQEKTGKKIIINAVIHRDYSLQGKDIKIAIFDDMLEITSPGTIPPSIDLNNLYSGQSEIRNKTLGPIFKELQLIEQWGTGFQKLSDELKEYPEIELKINEPGLSFQIQFIKRDYQSEKGGDQAGTMLEPSWDQASPQVPSNHPASTQQVPRKYLESTPQAVKTLQFCEEYKFRQEIQDHLGLADREHFRKTILIPLIENLLLKMSSPEKPNSPNQKYIITEKGKLLME